MAAEKLLDSLPGLGVILFDPATHQIVRCNTFAWVITRRDAPDAVVMSLDTFNSWMETVHLLKTPANAAHLAKSIQQLRKGKVRAHALVDA